MDTPLSIVTGNRTNYSVVLGPDKKEFEFGPITIRQLSIISKLVGSFDNLQSGNLQNIDIEVLGKFAWALGNKNKEFKEYFVSEDEILDKLDVYDIPALTELFQKAFESFAKKEGDETQSFRPEQTKE